jgi:hypothetical protein
MQSELPNTQPPTPAFSKRRAVLFGKDSDSIIKSFFGSTATVAIIVLTLITVFLFKEGAGFIGLYHKSLQEYRLSGLEYVDILKEKRDGYTAAQSLPQRCTCRVDPHTQSRRLIAKGNCAHGHEPGSQKSVYGLHALRVATARLHQAKDGCRH